MRGARVLPRRAESAATGAPMGFPVYHSPPTAHPVPQGSQGVRQACRSRTARATRGRQTTDRGGSPRTSPGRRRRCGCRRRIRSRVGIYRVSYFASMPLLTLSLLLIATQVSDSTLQMRVAARIAKAPARAVGVYYRDLAGRDSLMVGSTVRFHAASTMKVPVMIQLFRDRDARLLSLDDSIVVTNTFRSIVDGSPYQLDVTDDSDSSLYKRVGRRASIRELIELMETVSSNLATNLLITKVDAKRANATAHALGADSILVLRGVEDGKAYRAGLNNTTTARDLGMLLAAIANGKAASAASCREMLAILGRQQFKEGIPAGLPAGTRVYHKTGWIDQVVYHDAALVEPAGGGGGGGGGGRYVLVVLTGGLPKSDDA